MAQNNSSSLTEIQSKYPNCNLLVPAATSVQINPFYKCTVMEVVADTSERSGDIFSVGKVKVGEHSDGKAKYEEVFSPAKPLLMKLATAAGIQFHPEYTTVRRENANTYVGRAYGALRLPDGSYKTHAETKRVCLDDEEAKYRLEFMDKSITGITDWRAAKSAEEMFKGHWEDTEETKIYNGREYPVKKYVIDDCDREKYVERSVLVNMTLLRKTASEKAQTGAILRVVRALLGIKGTYSREELSKPFVVPTVTFAPDFNDPTVRNAMLQQGMNSMGNMFGTASAPPAIPAAFAGNAFSDNFDPEAEVNNPAFASDASFVSDMPVDEEMPYQEAVQTGWGHSQGTGMSPQGVPEPPPPQMGGSNGDIITQDLYCDQCNVHISEKAYEYSLKKYGRPLCMKCQKGTGR